MLATVQDFKELTTGGFGWIQNLIDIDHYFILPSLFGLSNLVILEVCIEIFINLYNINIDIILLKLYTFSDKSSIISCKRFKV